MTSPRHLSLFLTLGLFWGVSPSLYQYWGLLGMPVSHVIALTGIGVAAALALICQLRGIDWIGGKQLHFFGLGCAVLMNVPFALGLFFARHVPPTELALIISTAPIVNYLVALATRRENAAPRRLLAILLGFISTAILVITREGMLSGEVSWWLIAAFSLPVLYSAYNFFAAAWGPHGCHPMAAGVAESTWSGLLALPFLLLLAPPWSPDQLPLAAYWTVLLACGMWTLERIAFFTLIQEKGAVFTVQAVYLSTPAAVVIALAFYGGADIWLFVSLAVLMGALYLNNTGSAARPTSA
jgi:drug/metabolite transporter (DMT)-like permease